MLHLAVDNYSDQTLKEKAEDVLSRNITIRATRGYAIVAFVPYRRFGQIVVPDKHKEESCEAIMVDDATGYCLPAGTKVVCSRGDGTYFEVEGIRFCRIKARSMYAIEEAA